MVDLESIDVNLLVALDALLSERSVTRAGKKVGIAQSSMSHALARLRELFGDPLLVRSTDGMVPTPQAEAIEAPLREALLQLRKVVQGSAAFDPGAARDSFTLATDTLQQVILLPRLLEHLKSEAPGVALHIVAPVAPETTYRRLRTGELDIAIGRFDTPPSGIHRATLCSNRVVYVARKSHPRIRRTLSAKRLKEETQLIPTPVTTGQLSTPYRANLESQRREAVSLVTTPHLLASLLVVSQSDVITGTIERVAEMYKDLLGLRIFPPPMELPAIDTHIIWHERTHHSPAHRWFADQLMEFAK